MKQAWDQGLPPNCVRGASRIAARNSLANGVRTRWIIRVGFGDSGFFSDSQPVLSDSRPVLGCQFL